MQKYKRRGTGTLSEPNGKLCPGPAGKRFPPLWGDPFLDPAYTI